METRVSLPFADGVYDFWLSMPSIIAAEREMSRIDSAGARQPHSIFALYHDIGANLTIGYDGNYVLIGSCPARLSDMHAIIRNGLIGGGSGVVRGETVMVNGAMADDLIATYCAPARPAMLDIQLAWSILKAAIDGIENVSKKKDNPPLKAKRSAKASSLATAGK